MDHQEDEQSGESSMEKHNESMELDQDSTLEESSNVNESKNNSLEFSIANDSKSSTVVNALFSSEELIKNSTWKLGQLAWARMSIYPFWPCMITNDPNSMMSFQKVQTIGKSKTLMVHVHFFNDNGRHSWIPSHHMIPFNGIEDFRKRASLVTDIIRKKEPKFAAALTIKPNIYGTWQKAVAEAMDVLYDLDMSPLENFKPRQKDSPSNASKNNSSIKKRKRKDDDSKNAKKPLKQTDTSDDSRLSTNVSNAEVESNLNLETPPISPPNEDDLRAANFQKQKRISKMINKLQPPDFEVYYERNFFTIREQHSDATDEQVREYLFDVWKSMAPEEKSKYRSTYKIENDS